MSVAVHVIDAGDGASAMLASALAVVGARDGGRVVAVGDSAGREMLAGGGLRIDAWTGTPCGVMRLARRPVSRAVRAACGGASPTSARCWSPVERRASDLASVVRRAFPQCAVRTAPMHEAVAALDSAPEVCGDPSGGAGTPHAAARRGAREAIGVGDESLVVLAAADAPRVASSLRMLDVVGRAMLAGADAHLVMPACMQHLVRTRRYARGLGIDGRLHVVDGAERPLPWWHAADVVLVTADSPLVESVARLIGLRVLSAPGHQRDEAIPELRASAALVRDGVATALIAAARARGQPAMNASAASA